MCAWDRRFSGIGKYNLRRHPEVRALASLEGGRRWGYLYASMLRRLVLRRKRHGGRPWPPHRPTQHRITRRLYTLATTRGSCMVGALRSNNRRNCRRKKAQGLEPREKGSTNRLRLGQDQPVGTAAQRCRQNRVSQILRGSPKRLAPQDDDYNWPLLISISVSSSACPRTRRRCGRAAAA
jgi:hypothetical protein